MPPAREGIKGARLEYLLTVAVEAPLYGAIIVVGSIVVIKGARLEYL